MLDGDDSHIPIWIDRRFEIDAGDSQVPDRLDLAMQRRSHPTRFENFELHREHYRGWT